MTQRRIIIISLGIFIIGLFIGLLIGNIRSNTSFISPFPGSELPPTPTIKPLLKYTFNNLQQYIPQPSLIQLENTLEENPQFTSYLFSYTSQQKLITGQLNIPTGATPSAGFPAILMIRGFIEPEVYETGMGTKKAAAYFANNGFITIAPDFLGYGSSDMPANDVIEARIEKPLHVIDLLASLKTQPHINSDKIGLWGHSNGGQITLSVLEITGISIPTTLWAPVSKPFPYSILYYTDQFDDQGKALRQVIADFEDNYNVFDYSIDKYWHQITAPLQIHQGTSDPDVSLDWTNQLVEVLEEEDIDVSYFVYRGADHNLRPSWSAVVNRDLVFFQEHFGNK